MAISKFGGSSVCRTYPTILQPFCKTHYMRHIKSFKMIFYSYVSMHETSSDYIRRITTIWLQLKSIQWKLERKIVHFFSFLHQHTTLLCCFILLKLKLFFMHGKMWNEAVEFSWNPRYLRLLTQRHWWNHEPSLHCQCQKNNGL